MKAGSVFAILTHPESDLLVLKKVDSKSLQVDLRLFHEIEKAWEEVQQGKARKASRENFLEELKTW